MAHMGMVNRNYILLAKIAQKKKHLQNFLRLSPVVSRHVIPFTLSTREFQRINIYFHRLQRDNYVQRMNVNWITKDPRLFIVILLEYPVEPFGLCLLFQFIRRLQRNME